MADKNFKEEVWIKKNKKKLNKDFLLFIYNYVVSFYVYK